MGYNQNIKHEWEQSTTMDLLVTVDSSGRTAYREAIITYNGSHTEIETITNIELIDTDLEQFNPSLFADHSDYAFDRIESELYEYGEVA